MCIQDTRVILDDFRERAPTGDSVVVDFGAFEQLLAALRQMQHPQVLAGLGVALTQGHQRGNR